MSRRRVRSPALQPRRWSLHAAPTTQDAITSRFHPPRSASEWRLGGTLDQRSSQSGRGVGEQCPTRPRMAIWKSERKRDWLGGSEQARSHLRNSPEFFIPVFCFLRHNFSTAVADLPRGGGQFSGGVHRPGAAFLVFRGENCFPTCAEKIFPRGEVHEFCASPKSRKNSRDFAHKPIDA